MIDKADVVVIGGGCMGASTTYHLARRGVKRVALVEKSYLASGPTGDSSAVVRQHYPLRELVITSLKSLRVFERFDEIVGGDPEFVRTGWLLLLSQDSLETVGELLTMQQALGVKAELLSPGELEKLQPQTNFEGVAAAAYHPETGYANPVTTTNLFASAASDNGAEILEDTRVTGIRLDGDRVVAVTTSRGEISTPVVVNAAGVWGRKVGLMVGVDLPIGPTRHQICLFRRPYDYWQSPMVYADAPVRAYYRPESDDMVLVGTANEVTNHDKADPDDYNDQPDADMLSWCLSRLQYRIPVMKRASYRGGYSGLYDTTPDEQPIIGPVPGIEGFYCLTGWSGHGFKHSPAMGDLMAELITEGKTTDVDLSIFRPGRFREGELIEARPY